MPSQPPNRNANRHAKAGLYDGAEVPGDDQVKDGLMELNQVNQRARPIIWGGATGKSAAHA